MPLLNVSPYIAVIASSLSMEVMTISYADVQKALINAMDSAVSKGLWRQAGENLLVHPLAILSVQDDWQHRLAYMLCIDCDAGEQVLSGEGFELTADSFADLVRAAAAAVMIEGVVDHISLQPTLAEAISLSSTSGEPLTQSQIRIERQKHGLRLVKAA
ncbi:hypothetical protein [Pseudomonas sp. LS-2]|uniref:hypothetical protein n=1 Tax=Pseudomonas sp. LS-2 TaxID=2315859 RepID=UPI000E74EE07|nr:hypothetical protein [Pseudomonas sp. LS-2]RJX72583.1 hypothetical protein D3M70_30740 [Pseudomonas sp. LS-2]